MDENRDDDALSWAGEGADPTLAPTGVRGTARPRAERSATDSAPDSARDFDEDGAFLGDARVARTAEPEPTDPQAEAAASSLLLVAIGVAAGVYLLLTIGWVVAASRAAPAIAATSSGDLTGTVLSTLGLWLAGLAPVAWFAGVLLLSREARPRTRILWLVAGVLLLLPLPFLKGT